MYAKSRKNLPLSLYDTYDLFVVKSKIFVTNKYTISYEEVEFEKKLGQGYTPAGDTKIVIPNHDSKILVGAKVIDYDGSIGNNCIVSTPVLSTDRLWWSVRIVSLTNMESIVVKGKLILTYLG